MKDSSIAGGPRCIRILSHVGPTQVRGLVVAILGSILSSSVDDRRSRAEIEHRSRITIIIIIIITQQRSTPAGLCLDAKQALHRPVQAYSTVAPSSESECGDEASLLLLQDSVGDTSTAIIERSFVTSRMSFTPLPCFFVNAYARSEPLRHMYIQSLVVSAKLCPSFVQAFRPPLVHQGYSCVGKILTRLED